MIKNNLKNVKTTNVIYSIKQTQLSQLLDADLRRFLKSSNYLSIVITDNYFLHYSLYPMLEDNNEDYILSKVLEFQKDYISKEEFAKLRSLTVLDDTLSTVYSYYFTKLLLKELKKEVEKELSESNQSDMANILNQILLRLFSEDSYRQKLNEFQNEAAEKTKKLSDIKDFIMDIGAGKSFSDFKKVLDLSEKIASNALLFKIITEGKKIQTKIPTFVKITKIKEKHGEELAEYTLTRNVLEAKPSEFALPSEIFYYRLASGGFISLAKHTIAEGAYYVMIDKSGSMSSEAKIVYSRSLALALFKLAKRKKRKYFLQFFDTYVYPFKPLDDPEEILECIFRIENSGGTDIDDALYVALNNIIKSRLNKYTNTIILITDGEDTVTIQKELFEKNNVSLISIMVGGENETLKQLSNKYFKAELSEEGILEIIEAIK